MYIGSPPRKYQHSIFETARSYNTLAVLPTGIGKTVIAMMLCARRLLVYPSMKVVILAPTKPLVEQHESSFRSSLALPDEKIVAFTGSISPSKRQELWKQASIIISTPQTLENDILSNTTSLEDVSLMVFDEAHRAMGNYSYVFLAKEYLNASLYPRILALTASPGTDKESIETVCNNMGVERIEFRSTESSDVKPYTNKTSVSWEQVVLPEKLSSIASYLSTAFRSVITEIKQNGFLSRPPSSYNKTLLLRLQKELQQRLADGEKSSELLSSMSLTAQAIKIHYALELAQTQSIKALYAYIYSVFEDAQQSKSKAVKNLVLNPSFRSAFALCKEMYSSGEEHPKLFVLKSKVSALIKKNPRAKIIIFTQFRETAHAIESLLSGISSQLFFGQAKKNGVGLSQKKQKEVLDNFRNGSFSVLIATSVAEEGLDIPSVDHVFFYEPLPSAIRSVQRRGRTGRHSKGFVTVLIAKGTRDEASRWISFRREKKMYDTLREIAKSYRAIDKSQTSLDNMSSSSQIFDSKNNVLSSSQISSSKKPSQKRIVADFREKGSSLLKELRALPDISLELKQLEVGDFVLSSQACVEFKNTRDFVDSIVDGRLLSQMKSLTQYPKPILLLEGPEEDFNTRRVHPSAIKGALCSIALSFQIPIIRTSSPKESARMLSVMASQEQDTSGSSFSFHHAKPLDQKSLVEYITSSFPSVGPSLAKSLLEHFDSIHALVTASKKDLESIPLIGPLKASAIYDIIHTSYKTISKKNPRYSS
ncbi:MAG: DEAD/DEAH box helicase [Nanobdellota archaeon]